MSYVNHKTNTPGGSDLYGYAFLSLPNPQTVLNPYGVTIDGSIMPARDVEDQQHQTDTWKEMHGVDLYFLEEGAAERYYAMTQFTNDRANKQRWPESWQSWRTVTGGWIESYYWQYACGRWIEAGIPSRHSGVGRCYEQRYLNISAESQLPEQVMTWKDGSDIELYIPAGLGYPHAGQYCRNYLEDAIAPLDQSMMISHVADFASGMPLSAQPIRKLYKDMERLKYYVLPGDNYTTEDPNGPYDGQIWPLAWYRTASDYLDWTKTDPDKPDSYLYTDIVNQQSRAFGNPTYQGMYEIYEVDYGDYKIPFCGKQGTQDNFWYEPIYGSEVAVYICLKLVRKIPYNQWLTEKYGFFRMHNYTVNRAGGYVELDAYEMVRAAYSLINKYNAEIPHTIPPTYRDGYETYVRLEGMYSVCKLTDRTDTTQLDWSLRPQ